MQFLKIFFVPLQRRAMNRIDNHILKIALPAIASNITTPLLGLVDTAIVGHMGDAAYIGAVAVGAMIFNLLYWVFGFLRMGTSGLTAQALGRNDDVEVTRLLVRSGFVSLAVAMFILVFQWPLRELMLWFVGPTADVRSLASTYFDIVVWGAPAMLGVYSLNGWFIGMQSSHLLMFVSVVQNVANILASLTLVYGLGMKVEGVAIGTCVAQYIGFLAAAGLLWRNYRQLPFSINIPRMKELKPFLRVNRDIFLRTLFLVAVNLYFTSAGARQGSTLLAVNTLLFQLYLLFSFVMDGFAFAGEALGGKYWGAGDAVEFRRLLRRLFLWGAGMTMLFSTVYIIEGMPFLRLLTDEPMVVEASRQYVWWAYLIPVAGVAAFVWDGLFIGITYSRGMLQSSCLAAVVFFSGVFLLMPEMGNHGLWLSMILYLMARGVLQTVLFFRTKVKYDGTDTKFL